MLATIFITGIALYWLLIETDYLRVRLLVGNSKKPKYARYSVWNSASRKTLKADYLKHKGNNFPADYSPNGEPEYQILLSPGIDNVLCGFDWLDKHCADLVDYSPDVSMHIGGVRYSMTIKEPAIIKDIMRVNKLTRKQKMMLV